MSAAWQSGASHPKFRERMGRGPRNCGLLYRLSVSFTEAEWDRIKAAAKRRRVTLSSFGRAAVLAELEKAMSGREVFT